MSVLDKFLDAIRLNDDFDDDDEFFDDEDLEALDEEKPKHRFFKKLDDDDDEDEEVESLVSSAERQVLPGARLEYNSGTSNNHEYPPFSVYRSY